MCENDNGRLAILDSQEKMDTIIALNNNQGWKPFFKTSVEIYGYIAFKFLHCSSQTQSIPKVCRNVRYFIYYGSLPQMLSCQNIPTSGNIGQCCNKLNICSRQLRKSFSSQVHVHSQAINQLQLIECPRLNSGPEISDIFRYRQMLAGKHSTQVDHIN